MDVEPVRPTAGRGSWAGPVSRLWYGATAAVSLASLLVQLVLVVSGVDVLVDETGNAPATWQRVLRFFSYFTVQSNLLVIATSATLALRPQRDGRIWRVLRLDGLVGITVTLIVYHFLLAPILDLHGINAVTDVGFHYVTPILAITGWLLFGPRRRITGGVLAAMLIWPVLWFGYTLAHGAIAGWYPYPFIDAAALGHAAALTNAGLITLLLLGIAGLFLAGDRLLPRTGRAAQRAEATEASSSS